MSTNRSATEWWCSLCDRTFWSSADTFDRICPYCKGRGKGADITRVKAAAFRRARDIAGLPLRRFRLVRNAGEHLDYWAPAIRGDGYVNVWFPMGDKECNEALQTAKLIQIIGGRMVAYFGQGWEPSDKFKVKAKTAAALIADRNARCADLGRAYNLPKNS